MLAERGWSATAASSTTSIVLWIVALSVPLGGFLADRLGRRDLVIGFGDAASAILMFGASAANETVAIFVALGIVIGLAAGPIMSLPGKFLAPGNRATGMGLFFTLFYVAVMVAPIGAVVPNPADIEDPAKRETVEGALKYMDLTAGQKMTDIYVDKVFIGSCTNSRIEDIRAAAAVAKGRKVADSVYAMVVPGSGLIKEQAEEEGLDRILIDAGFDWREPGCSMCLGMNGDMLEPGERSASTSNRNFQGRQGPGGRTHLVSPAMAAAAAVTGHLTDVRELVDTEAAE